MTEKLRQAKPIEVQRLQYEVQKLRVAIIISREITNGISDPNAYKEMRLLSMMSKTVEFEDEQMTSIEEHGKVVDRLKERGISPESATRIAKVLSSVMAAGAEASKKEPEDDGDDAEPIPINTIRRHE